MCFFPLHDDNFEDEVQSQRETERIFFEYISKVIIITIIKLFLLKLLSITIKLNYIFFY
jgi:hypothetical protein